MLTKQRLSGLLCAGVIGLAAAGCSSGGEDAGAPSVTFDESTADETTADDTSEDGADGSAEGGLDPSDDADTDTEPDTADSEVITVDDPRLSDGVWAVGDAGTVEFTIGDGGLELIEALPDDGWEHEIEVDGNEEIEVDFRQEGREHTIEIEYDDGVLEIEIDLEVDPAEPGTFALGPAGTVEIAVDGDDVRLVDLSPADGWDVTEQDTDDGEVDIQLRQGDVVWDFEAEVDDDRLEVHLDFEIEGAYP